jgi:hypothetical protein
VLFHFNGEASADRGREPVPDGRVALQELTPLVTKLPADPIRINLEIMLLVFISGSPNILENHSARADLALMSGQIGEKLELLGCKVKSNAVKCRLMMYQIEMQRTDIDLDRSRVIKPPVAEGNAQPSI